MLFLTRYRATRNTTVEEEEEEEEEEEGRGEGEEGGGGGEGGRWWREGGRRVLDTMRIDENGFHRIPSRLQTTARIQFARQ